MSRRRRIMVSAVMAAVLMSGGTATATYAASPDIPRGTTVMGVTIGEKTREAAALALREALTARAEQLSQPVQVRIGDQVTTISPQDAGLAVDVDATVQEAIDAGHNPFIAIPAVFGHQTRVRPVLTVDDERLTRALAGTAAKAGATAVMPAVVFDGTTPVPVYPKAGLGLDKQVVGDTVSRAWLAGEPANLSLVQLTPVSTAADVDRMVADLAKPAVASPVTVRTDKGEFALTRTAIAKSLVISSDAQGRLDAEVDSAMLREAAKSQLQRVEVAAQEARVDTGSGKPTVLAGTGGTMVDVDKLAGDLLPVLGRGSDRSVHADLVTVEPKSSGEQLAALGIREQVSTFTTRFDGGLSVPRNKNVVQAAKKVDGAVVKPGETFSLNGYTGPRGYAEGYVDAPIIMNGKLVPGVGGGVSQFTTTIFNAAYYAGLEDVEHRPHSYYFNRYPSVIESTIFYPNLDLKFRNDTPYGVLIDTSYTDDSVTVSMWSTKLYDSVTTEYGPRRDVVQPKRVVLPGGDGCIATSGIEGFTQDAWRVFRKDGAEVKREKFSWRYDAEPRFVCD